MRTYLPIGLLLNQLVQNNGERWYWLKEDFESLGDAYDDIVDNESLH
ncbi:hypothetical protein [Paenibacillus hemerocallicola]|nr:hypothetical protein [Paenibacillus hemerocallicola]